MMPKKANAKRKCPIVIRGLETISRLKTHETIAEKKETKTLKASINK